MNIIVTPNKLQGKIEIPSDKSFCHRAIISACIANGKSVIKNVNMCDDVKNTINILRQIYDIEVNGKNVYVNGGKITNKIKSVTIEESASTLRFLLPMISYLMNEKTDFIVSKKLKNRGIEEYYSLLNNDLINEKENGYTIKSFVDKDEYKINADKSSQYITGLLFLCMLLKHDTKIILTGSMNSISYVDLTIEVLNMFDAKIEREENIIFIKQKELNAKEIECLGDGSVYLMYQILNKLGSNIEISNSLFETKHPDYVLANKIINNEFDNEFDLSDNPDAIFSLVLLKKELNKDLILTNIERLKNKEIDRKNALVDLLNKTGSEFENLDNKLIIKKINIKNMIFDSKNDHRFAMFGVLLSSVFNKKIQIKNAECVTKSYPSFYKNIQTLGCDIKAIDKCKKISYKVEKKKINIFFKTNDEYKSKMFINKKVCIITENNIPKEYCLNIKKMLLNNSALSVNEYILKNTGEEIKTLNNAKEIMNFLLINNYTKSDVLCALGGGTITDLAGFVGSIYKRGIMTVYVPTTLIAQVDASIGGKTGLNLETTKNVIGTFYNPKEILIDTNFLKSLPQKEIISGLMEIIKIFSIYDQKMFFDIYDAKDLNNLIDWIYKAVEIKVKIVEQDPFDDGVRKTLNFGHTIGHAIELYKNIPHGIAVAEGMLYESDNIFIKNIMSKYGIIKQNYDANIFDGIKNDKKVQQNYITIVELENIGKCKLVKKNVDDFKRKCD